MQLSSQARKAMATGLAASTLLWAAAGIVPQIASAAVHSEGCLVLSGGTVWMITGGTRRGYTSAEVFQSWGRNFSEVVVASTEDVSLPVGPIQVYADGTLVKGPNDPLVYLVAGGQKRPFTSGAVFTGLGFSFANIQSAPANTFADLPTGANLDSSAIAHPAGVQVISNGAIWWMDANGRRGFATAAMFNSYGYKFSHVVQANSYDLALPNLGDVPSRASCTGGGGTTPPPASGAMSVSLASDNPGVTTLVTTAIDGAQALANMLKLNFTAGSSGATVTTVSLHRTGIAADGDIANLYLYDGNTRVAEMSSVSDRVFTFNNASGLFSVPANSTRVLWVAANLTDAALSGKTIGFSLNSASDVMLSGGTAASGSFPLNGSVMNTATVTDLGRFTVASTQPTAPASVDPGSLNRQVLTTLSMVAANQNLAVSYVKFTEIGSIANTDLTNLKLMDGATQLGATAQIGSDYSVVFDLSASPYMITSGQTKNLSLVADVIGGTSRSFKFTIQRQSDIIVRDQSYGVYIKPYTNGTTETFAIIQPSAATSITSGTLAVTVDPASPTGNIALNSTNVELARFKFVANGEAVKVLSVPIQITLTTATNIKNVKLMLDGSQIGTTVATLASDAVSTFPTSGDFGSSFVVPAGTTGRVLSIRADISSASGTLLAATHTIVAKLNAGSSNAQGVTSLSSLSTGAANGRTLTVQTGSLVAAKNLSVNDGSVSLPTAVKGTAGAKIGSFVLTAGAGEAVSVSQIAVTDSVTNLNATGVATTVHGAVTNVASISVTVAELAPFVVGESYYISTDVSPTLNNATITVTAKAAASGAGALTVTGSGLVGTIGINAASHIFASASGTDTLADVFQNLRLMQGATQVGTTVTSLTDTAATVYTFTPATAININAGAQAVFDVFADVKNTATTLSVNSDATGIVSLALAAATATGVTTSSTANSTGTPTLQNVYVAAGGSLTVAVSGDSAIGQQVVMGTTDVELGKFKLAETSLAEDVTVTQLVVTDTTGTGSVQNLKLYNGATLLGTVASLDGSNNATFTGLNLTVPKGNNVILTVKADFTPYPGGTSASSHVVSVASFTGNGVQSGASLASSASSGTAGTMTGYRTKLTIAHAADAPAGASSGSSAQTVAKFVVSNTANVGNYTATLTGMELNLGSTISWSAGATAVRYVTIYKNSISGAVTHAAPVATGTALGAYGFNPDVLGSCTTASNLKCSVAAVTGFSNLTLGAANFVDVDIAAGSSVTILVTANTSDAVSAKNFSAGVAAGAITWSDGVTTAITTVDSLPLAGKTLTY